MVLALAASKPALFSGRDQWAQGTIELGRYRIELVHDNL